MKKISKEFHLCEKCGKEYKKKILAEDCEWVHEALTIYTRGYGANRNLAKILGVSYPTIHAWRSGHRHPDQKTLKILKNLFKNEDKNFLKKPKKPLTSCRR